MILCIMVFCMYFRFILSASIPLNKLFPMLEYYSILIVTKRYISTCVKLHWIIASKISTFISNFNALVWNMESQGTWVLAGFSRKGRRERIFIDFGFFK